MMTHTYNPYYSAQAEAVGPEVQGPAGQLSKVLSQNKK